MGNFKIGQGIIQGEQAAGILCREDSVLQAAVQVATLGEMMRQIRDVFWFSLLVLLFQVGLDPSSLVRIAHAERENRSLIAEHNRLVGGIKQLQTINAELEDRNQELSQQIEALIGGLEKIK